MADTHDTYDTDTNGGNGFMMGLLTGTVLGAGLGMLLAPKTGTDLRGQIGDQAKTFSNKASEQYRRASESATEWAERGREAMGQARDAMGQAREAVSRGAEEARAYAKGTTAGFEAGPNGTEYPRP